MSGLDSNSQKRSLTVPMRDGVLELAVAALEGQGISYKLMRCGPDCLDASTFSVRYRLPLEHIINTIIIATNRKPRKYAACILTARHRIVSKAARDLLGGGKISFAVPDELAHFTGMTPGVVTPFALPAELPIFVDDKVAGLDWGVFGSGNPSWRIKTSPDALFQISTAVKTPGLARGVPCERAYSAT